eukprot:scaffold5.g771.t1
MAPRPTHDGSDYAYRQIIEDKYRRMAKLRGTVKRAATLAVLAAALRTAWHAAPALGAAAASPACAGGGAGACAEAAGEALRGSGLDLAVCAATAVVALVALYALGFGKAARDRLWALRLYRTAAFLLTAEAGLRAWHYYMRPSEARVAARLVALGGWWDGPAGAGLLAGARVLEAAVDAGLAAACFAGSLAAKQLLAEKRVGPSGGRKQE